MPERVKLDPSTVTRVKLSPTAVTRDGQTVVTTQPKAPQPPAVPPTPPAPFGLEPGMQDPTREWSAAQTLPFSIGSLGTNLWESGKNIVTGTLKSLPQVAETARQVALGRPGAAAPLVQDMAVGTAKGVYEPSVEWAEGLSTGNPEQMARGTSRFITETVPTVGGTSTASKRVPPAVRSAASKAKVPEKLMTKAATRRAKTQTRGTGGTAVMSTSAGYVAGGPPVAAAVGAVNAANIVRKAAPVQKFVAGTQERLARWLSKSDQPPTFAPDRPAGAMPEVPFKPPEAQVYQHVERPQAGPMPEVPFKPPEVPAYQHVEQPLAGPLPELPFDGSSLTERAAAPPSLSRVESAIRPTGRRAQQSTLYNAPRLVEVAPEVARSTYETFPRDSVKALRRTEEGIELAEAAIPPETLVPRQPILEGFARLAEEYKSRGLTKAEAQMEKLGEQWSELTPPEIPWSQFLKMKRAFFGEHNVNQTPMLRAYGHLMDASSKISDELSNANRSYSIVRRAIQDAGVDIRTGRRIREVGKTSKGPTPAPPPPAL